MAKWTGAGLCALIFAVWLVSGWSGVEIAYSGSGSKTDTHVLVGNGFLGITLREWANPAGSATSWWIKYYLVRPDGRVSWDWLPRWDHSRPRPPSPFIDETLMAVPLYIPLVLLALPTAWLFYRDRRSVRWREAGRCVGCGYDLAGNTTGVCPECGAKARHGGSGDC